MTFNFVAPMGVRALPLLVGVLLWAAPGLAQSVDWRESAQTALHLLDYVGVDYPEFVRDGEVVNGAEYEEQVEFAARVVALLEGLPERQERARLVSAAEALAALVRAKASGPRVAAVAADLRWAVVDAYALAVAPKKAPDLTRGRDLYRESCATCHGAEGKGNGTAGQGLNPAPADLTDPARMDQRSAYGLYNTITLGVAGTGMAAFKQLSEDDRWALAFFVAGMSATPQQLADGEVAWKTGAYAAAFPDFENVSMLSTNEVGERFGPDAGATQVWLRAHPEALAAARGGPIGFALATLQQSLSAYRAGDRASAERLAVAAYLEGVELLEASLESIDGQLRTRIEREMATYRAQLTSGAPTSDAERQVSRITDLLRAAERKLQGHGLSPGAMFASSLLILLREGLEAILVLAAIIAFLVKSGRRDALPWVHLGWLTALVSGGVTWLVATHVVSISGASREMTEAVTALCAAAVLAYVGLWLHSRGHARAWQAFLREQIGGALGRRTLWAMASVSFLAVYRELFELVLFYQALWAQGGDGGRAPLLGGIASAAILLAFVGWGVFQYGLRLPLSRFFAATSMLLGALAVIFVGQGVSALQEAGTIGVSAVDFVRVPELGIFPTAQTLAAQVAVAVLLIASFSWANRQQTESTEAVDAH